ncbi:hypothetical protein HUT06_33515 [Actinomadura sp. NAK00032]|uniref:hypothetical protein n=1 Tax=Actinomadura sp. NAK00032 TaxID=2742128 RepID=UPI0015922CF3|nr:hypothetical protein [Actinomadura sp. NAK00032]QKW38321.1 hypothetical protein HUT06_33515 [Actinomadura sp. NAK00032]
MKITLLWAVPLGILAVVAAEWALLANPGGRLVGLVLLAVLLGFIGVFALAPVTLAVGAVGERWGTAAAVLLVGTCLSVAVLAIIGSIERAKPGYAWKYGEPVDAAVPHDWTCTLSGYKCAGSWRSQGKTVHGSVTMSRAEHRALRSPLAVAADGAHHLKARALNRRAATAGLHLKPASSVALGKVPEWTGWTAGAIGLGATLFAIVLPHRTPRTTPEAR